MIGQKVKFEEEIPHCGLIGIAGSIGTVVAFDWIGMVYKVEFQNGETAWFRGEDLHGRIRDGSCDHNYKRFVGFNLVSDICTRCGDKKPVDMMRK